jgi:hypothetical protein
MLYWLFMAYWSGSNRLSAASLAVLGILACFFISQACVILVQRLRLVQCAEQGAAANP